MLQYQVRRGERSNKPGLKNAHSKMATSSWSSKTAGTVDEEVHAAEEELLDADLDLQQEGDGGLSRRDKKKKTQGGKGNRMAMVSAGGVSEAHARLVSHSKWEGGTAIMIEGYGDRAKI